MASTAGLPNFVDWARVLNPNGVIEEIAWLLSQNNEMYMDQISQMGNLPLGHKVSVQAGIPQGTYRMANQGVAPTKGIYEQYQFEMSELVEYSCVDKSILTLKGQREEYLWTQTQAAAMGMGQQQASTILYGNSAINPTQFAGFMSFYNTLNTSIATSKNVLSGGGSGSANASILLACWGNDIIYDIFPEGSTVGLQIEDKGDIRAIYDSNGNPFEGNTTYLVWKLGLAIQDWRYCARIANIDTTTAGIAGPTPPSLFDLMNDAVMLMPSLTRRASGIDRTDSPQNAQPGVKPAFYCNRTIRGAMNKQILRDKNVLIEPKEFDGIVADSYRGVPIRNMDQLLNTEATITT
jgi:hypothetical protein